MPGLIRVFPTHLQQPGIDYSYVVIMVGRPLLNFVKSDFEGASMTFVLLHLPVNSILLIFLTKPSLSADLFCHGVSPDISR